MKKVSCIGLLSLALLLGASASIDAATEKKKQNFFQKHKGKLIAGAAAALALGIGIALGMHTDKTMKAIEKAGISPEDDLFNQAVGAVGLLGPLGMQRTIDLMNAAIDRRAITTKQASSLVVGDIGKALVIYWGVEEQLNDEKAIERAHSAYIRAAGFGRIKLTARQAKDAASKTLAAVKAALR